MSAVAAGATLKSLALTGALAQNCEKVDAIPAGEYAMEPKANGWRILAEVRDGSVCFYSRSGKTYNGKMPEVEADLLAMFPPGSWVDGEATALDGWGSVQSWLSSEGVTFSAVPAITYMVFDLLAHRDIDARSLPYVKRRVLLDKIFAAYDRDSVILIPSVPASDEAHAEFVAAGWEGTVLKRLSAPYASGKRGRGWCKWKVQASEDAVIIGFEAGSDVGAVVFGQFKDGKLVKRGTCKRKPNVIATADPQEWVGRVIEVQHNGVLASGALRHPRLLRVRDDKAAGDCVWLP